MTLSYIGNSQSYNVEYSRQEFNGNHAYKLFNVIQMLLWLVPKMCGYQVLFQNIISLKIFQMFTKVGIQKFQIKLFHIKEIVLLVAEMRAFQVINQSLKSNCFMYQLLLFWFQKCMIARYFPTNNRSESSRTVTKDQIQIYTNLEIMNLYKFGENL